MGLIIQGNTVSTQNKLIINGNECKKVIMYGNTVWEKKVEQWDDLFTGSQSFTGSGSMSVPGINAGDTISVSATAEYTEIYEYEDYSESHDSITSVTRRTLPATIAIYDTANIELWASSGRIGFTFNEYYDEYKGEVVRYIPTKLTITEVRKLQ